MRTVTAVLAAIASLALVQVAAASNWRYAGISLVDDVRESRFFENNSLVRSGDGTLQVRIEAIPVERLTEYYAAHDGQLKRLADRRVSTGYVPSLLLMPQRRSLYPTAADFKNAVWRAVLMEAMANSGSVPASREYLVQIDCAGRRLRLLESAAFDGSGARLAAGTPAPSGAWVESADVPGTTGEPLQALFCAQPGQ
jgi:hypothetical protein